MEKYLLIITLLLTTFVAKGQNLVPNGDFEQHSSCPTYHSQIDKCLFWFNPELNGGGIYGTPDYFHVCGAPIVGVPENIRGWQYPHSGDAYSGIVTARDNINPDFREYLEVQLTSTLTANACYYFELYINLGNSSQYTSHNIGVYFSDTAITGSHLTTPLSYIPQLSNLPGNYPDTLNWSIVAGNYIATGGENYIIIGNFNNSSNTDTIFVANTSTGHCFVYIDDVSLTPCATGIPKIQNQTSAIQISPNPAKEHFELRISNLELNKKYELKVFDMMGKQVLKQKINLKSSIINIQSLKSGIYFIEINGVRKKLIKQ